MTVSPVQTNPGLNTGSNQRMNDSSTVWSRVKAAGAKLKQRVTTPLIFPGNLNINQLNSSCPDTQDMLRKIDRLAQEGLLRAESIGVRPDSTLIENQALRIDQQLSQETSPVQPTRFDLVGPVAQLPSPDAEVTRVLSLQKQTEKPNWEQKTTEYKDVLAEKLSAFSALWQMRSYAGINDRDTRKVLALVERATHREHSHSLWELFTNEYKDLSWVQKFKAGLFYWCCYQSSLISNTVEAYLDGFVEMITKDLVDEKNEKNRLIVLRKILENTNEFLVEDFRATNAFANATDPASGDLETFRKRAIETYYNNSLKELCRIFSEKQVSLSTREVSFFEGMKKIPLIKYVFIALQWVLNRFIIKRAMQSAILPAALKSAVENGLEATQPHNIPFTLAATKFLTERLEIFREKLEKDIRSKPAEALPGTEIIQQVIKNLKLVLDVEDFKTQPEIRKKLKQIEAGNGYIDRVVETIIVEGIKIGCHSLFDHINETAKSSELIAQLLKLACEPFNGQVKDPRLLLAEYKDEQAKLSRVSNALFDTIINTEIAKKSNPTKSVEEKQLAKDAFREGKIVTQLTMGKMVELSQIMGAKIAQSANGPTRENNIQVEIATFLQLMQSFANRKQIQDNINSLSKHDREAIWRELTPLYTRAIQIEEKIMKLQELQNDYPSHTTLTTQMKTVKERLPVLQRNFNERPRHFRNPLIATLDTIYEEISLILGVSAPVSIRFKGFITSLSTLSEKIVQEQQVIDAMHAFSPPVRNGEEARQEGLLDQLLNYERGIHTPGFQPRHCLAEIDKYLKSFPLQEQQVLRDLIGNGSSLRANWTRLGEVLQGMYRAHIQAKNENSAHFDRLIREIQTWAEGKEQSYAYLKAADHMAMQKIIREISTELAALSNEANTIQLKPPHHLSSNEVTGVLAAIGSSLGSSYAAWAVQSIALGGAVGAGVAAGAVWGLKKGVHLFAHKKIKPDISKLFENAYKLCLSPRVSHAAITRTMVELSKT